MELIIGGSFQGKLDYVLEYYGLTSDLVADGELADIKEIQNKPVLNHFHLYMKRLMKENVNVYEQVEMLLLAHPNIIIITNELGSGIVPLDAFERAYRELTGRVCCKLARKAVRVQRIVCGQGMVIKG